MAAAAETARHGPHIACLYRTVHTQSVCAAWVRKAGNKNTAGKTDGGVLQNR
jgi:hypothetical protein